MTSNDGDPTKPSAKQVNKEISKSSGDRSKDRQIEDLQSQPVIIKRIDQHQTHPDDTLEFAIREGKEQIERGWMSLLFSAIAAGLILGFAAMVVSKVKQLCLENSYDPLVTQVSMAMVYPLGFIICIMSGTQLFTEHTATAVYPYLDRKCSFKGLVKMLSLVALGNLLGTVASSLLIFLANPVVKAKQGYIEVALHLIHFTDFQIFVSAILAGWLMAQGAWLFLTTRLDVEKIFLIYIVTFIIGLCGLHHSIAGSAEIFTGYFFTNAIGLESVVVTIFVMLCGNLVGGAVFVALLNYTHIRQLNS